MNISNTRCGGRSSVLLYPTLKLCSYHSNNILRLALTFEEKSSSHIETVSFFLYTLVWKVHHPFPYPTKTAIFSVVQPEMQTKVSASVLRCLTVAIDRRYRCASSPMSIRSSFDIDRGRESKENGRFIEDVEGDMDPKTYRWRSKRICRGQVGVCCCYGRCRRGCRL